MYKYIFINLFFVNISFCLDYLSPNYFLDQKNNSPSDIVIQSDEFNYLIGIMVDFQVERDEFEDKNGNGYWDDSDSLITDFNKNGIADYNDYNNNGKYDQVLINGKLYYEDYDNPKTSGLGRFILDDSFLNYNLENFNSRCESLIIDAPPHDFNYFLNQLKAVKNYYHTVSNDLIDFEIDIINSNIYTVSNPMEYYSTSDQKLGELFSESLRLAKYDIENYLNNNNIDVKDVLFVVFHAGLGQDFSVPFLDPTTNDLKSAYIDEEMLTLDNLSIINEVGINRGILLPETQNFIFYDVVEDIFPELKSSQGYCGIQVGLTGTFSFLLGYGLGLNPLFLSDGTTGVGKFGLMDYGSNNGRGVIPAPPNPWTRIKIAEKYSTLDDLVETINQTGTYSLQPRNIKDKIYKVDISDSEYYLIENRNNHVIHEFDLEFLQFIYGGTCGGDINPNNMTNDDIDFINECMANSTSLDRLDYFNLLNKLDMFTLEDSIVVSVDNYDYGLPGSGLLIWHIDENRIFENSNCKSINCDLDNRAIQLEEADGAVDIGYNSSHPLFNDHINGWEYDFWYPGNEYYFNYGNSNISTKDTLFFNDSSNPGTQSNDGSSSLISIEIIDEEYGDISFNVSFDELYETSFLADSAIQILGSGDIDGIGNVFYVEDDNVYKHNHLGKTLLNEYVLNKKVLIYNNDYHFVDVVVDSLTYWDPDLELISVKPPFVAGYYESLDNLTVIDTLFMGSSFGDIDLDGFDELVFCSSDSSLVVKNYNGTYVNGFPITGDFFGTPIIANILNIEDDSPEIICREGNHILILSSEGNPLLELSSFDINQDIRIIPNWKNNQAALIDGNRLILFDYDKEYSYWLSKHSSSYDYPTSLNSNNPKYVNKIQSAYNYPNPITNGYTTFRFYVEDDNQIKINIYDVNGLMIKNFQTSNVARNEYNEIKWNNIKNLSAGLYYAEVVFENRNSELIKLAIVQ